MKPLLTILAATLLLTACSSGGLTAAQQTEAVNTAVAQMLNQAATDAALAGATQAPTSAPVEAAPTSNVEGNITIPPDAACLPVGTDRVVGTVTDVFTSDQFQVLIAGHHYFVRYLGIDATNQPKDINSQLVLGKQVLLVRDVTDVDEYGRMPRYVITDGVFVNVELVKRGVASPSPVDPDVSCKQAIQAALP